MQRPVHISLFVLGLLTSLGQPATVLAHSFQVAGIMVGHPWAPPAGGPDGVALLSLLNRGAEDRLIAASSPAATQVVLTESAGGGRVLEALVLAPNKPVALRQGRLVLTLKGLKAPLAEGQKFPLTLVFEKAGPLMVEVFVEHSPG